MIAQDWFYFTEEAKKLETHLTNDLTDKQIIKMLDNCSVGLFSMLFAIKNPAAADWQIMHFPNYYDYYQSLKDFKKENRIRDFHQHKPFFDMFFNFVDNELLNFIKDKVITNKA